MVDTEAFPACSLREKLKAIRDSDHWASAEARNVIQIMDELRGLPDDPFLLKALGVAVAMLERRMAINELPTRGALTPKEVALVFGLGDPQ